MGHGGQGKNVMARNGPAKGWELVISKPKHKLMDHGKCHFSQLTQTQNGFTPKTANTEFTSQVLHYENVIRPTWETRRGYAVLSPAPRRRVAGGPSWAAGRRVHLQLPQRQ